MTVLSEWQRNDSSVWMTALWWLASLLHAFLPELQERLLHHFHSWVQLTTAYQHPYTSHLVTLQLAAVFFQQYVPPSRQESVRVPPQSMFPSSGCDHTQSSQRPHISNCESGALWQKGRASVFPAMLYLGSTLHGPAWNVSIALSLHEEPVGQFKNYYFLNWKTKNWIFKNFWPDRPGFSSQFYQLLNL